jgi:hypothetical protein
LDSIRVWKTGAAQATGAEDISKTRKHQDLR